MTLENHAAKNRARGNFPLVPKANATKYSIEIPVDQFELITEHDSNILYHGQPNTATLYQRLGAQTPAIDVDYDAFFGCYVFYTLEKKNDHQETHNKIIKMIIEFIKEARENLADEALASYIGEHDE